ncbi:tRNA pseudouridine(55) synthase TruB [Corynebacterium bovis]|uniref:tRNA pseudouridine synthase B n=2 Tax=Corynebacterium bovis TaxID=36808 RepID=A0A426Q1M2_9CORY|nr:tRNA pseudouridine(55) synthase TruB [Corynebacterium bovis]RRO87921.1 tRNA pseudouridine(55) synthase TruB [Corynebacterium bovis]
MTDRPSGPSSAPRPDAGPARPDAARSAGSVLERSGLVIVDKPAGMTSHDVVSRLRRLFRTKRVGHAGTLDPDATGVLVVGVERGTKFLAHLVSDDKRYTADIAFGTTTVTDDAAGEVLTRATPEALAAVTEDRIRTAFSHQVGEIMQRPSSVSSVKVDGRRAHELVREGREVTLPARPVTVHALDVTAVADGAAAPVPTASVAVHCSSGTFIRAIARDVGEELGVGGHVTALRRTAVGPFGIDGARTLDALEAEARAGEDSAADGSGPADDAAPAGGAAPVPALSLTLDEAVVRSFPVREISDAEGADLALGKWLRPVGMRGVYAAVTPSGRAVALVRERGDRAASVFVARPHGLS